jgi:hypothetical protein
MSEAPAGGKCLDYLQAGAVLPSYELSGFSNDSDLQAGAAALVASPTRTMLHSDAVLESVGRWPLPSLSSVSEIFDQRFGWIGLGHDKLVLSHNSCSTMARMIQFSCDCPAFVSIQRLRFL